MTSQCPTPGRYVPPSGQTHALAQSGNGGSVEAQLTAALAKMAEAADNAELREAFEAHLEETRGHQRSVEDLLRQLGASPSEHEDQAMRAMIQEAEKMMGMV